MKLHRYFARRFLFSFLGVFAVFFAMITLLDVINQINTFKNQDLSFAALMGMTLLNAPAQIYEILPLIFILSTVWLFLALARSSELVVVRAAGRSALGSLMAPVLVTFLLGVFAVAVLNPIVAGTSKEYEQRAASYTQSGNATLSVGANGLWLRQGNEEGQTVIRAAKANLDGTELSEVSFITFSGDSGPIRRLDAQTAVLQDGFWTLTDVKQWPLSVVANPEFSAFELDDIQVPSNLTRDQIRDRLGTPSSIPIWQLPSFVAQLKDAGFSARRHSVWFHFQLALPIFLVSMVFIGAAFTMRHTRMGRTGLMTLSAVILGFVLFFVSNFAQILGENGELPIILAAWAPPLAAIGLALSFLLHLEDG